MDEMISHWEPIHDLPQDWERFVSKELEALSGIWKERADRLRLSKSYQDFLGRMKRKIAIETGVIERLYNIDRGVTDLLIQRGIDEALIPHGATDQSATTVVAMIRDHEGAVDWLFDFVARQLPLSPFYIRSLHQMLTAHQTHVEARDQFGNIGRLELLRGEWKKFPNNPTRSDGSVHTYCPPEQVPPQIDRMIAWHEEHDRKGVVPEVEAAWLHHRFTQIHPFQDGNGRVARCLASLVFIRAGWFPLVITRDDRTDYITALEAADIGNLRPLIDLFARRQREAFISSLSLSEQVLTSETTTQTIIEAAVDKIVRSRITITDDDKTKVEQFAATLFEFARSRLAEVTQQLRSALANLPERHAVLLNYADLENEQRNYYYRYQIIETARSLDYFANLSHHKSWINLTIRAEDNGAHTELLLSFHGLGRAYQGVLVCSGCAYHKVASDQEDNAIIQDIQPLSQSPFQITYLDVPADLEQRFQDWLENVIVVGLEYWRKSL
ncbi:MAG: Fic family protein [bacterium]|nr:Fic family protein [bacterium]